MPKTSRKSRNRSEDKLEDPVEVMDCKDMMALQEQIGSLEKALKEFVLQYELDMRGDKDMRNGNLGVINEIRKIKDVIMKYPSILYSFSMKPIQTITTVFGVLYILYLLFEQAPKVGTLFENIIKAFGL